MSEPIVSIIIPCYNAEAYVGEAIESALAQTYPSVEVIVVDDGSTDGSLEVIRSFGNRVRWETGPNRGGCAARNRGIEIATGEWVQLLDSDDVLYPSKLARQVPFAVEQAKSITYTDHFYRDVTTTEELRLRTRSVTDDDPLVFVLQHKTLSISGPLYWYKWLIGIGGFRSGLAASQEFELNLRLAAFLSRTGIGFKHLPEPLFEVRRRHGSVSSDTARTFAALVHPLEELIETLGLAKELSAARRVALAHYMAGIGRQCWRGGHVEAGKALIQTAEGLDAKAASAAWGPSANIARKVLGPGAVEVLANVRRALTSWSR
jgi:glycosyltransferase involved in cell wall biosynthesis